VRAEEQAVIRPFGLRDVLAVRSLQRDGVWLDLFHRLLLRRSALATALIAPVPWVGTGLASYVWSPAQEVHGFVQMLKRPGRYEADLLFLAPRLERQPYGRQAWEKLLAACIAEAGAQGLRRLFASVSESAAEIDVLASLGFMVYTGEQVFVLPRSVRHPQRRRIHVCGPAVRRTFGGCAGCIASTRRNQCKMPKDTTATTARHRCRWHGGS
jgi:GNAT superfamily N-acetyltransferase